MLPNFKKLETQPKAALSSPNMAAPSASGQRSDRNISIIGSDLTVTGDVISKGELRIDGEVKGDIDGNRVVVGEQARVTGTVRAEDVVIFGQVMGSVGGRRVSLQSTSRVEGDVYHQALILEQGAFFEGKSVRSDDPLVGHRQRLCRDTKDGDSGASNCS
jgi:cytoskeletal protein CcmA (bactofilin family)